MPDILNIGLDVGSTTAKIVVMDESGSLLHSEYRRHGARQAEVVREYLDDVQKRFEGKTFRVFVTGSGGRELAPHLGAQYVQEVNAVTFAVQTLHPDTGSVVELGGQDAKVIIYRRDEHGRASTLTFMNDKCAGGTGATIDKILTKIGLNSSEAAAIRADELTIHHVAAKCGVFAETDVVGLLKGGVQTDEIVVSLANAIVKQNLETLVRGNVLRDRILLLGGPHRFLPVFAELWRAHVPDLWTQHRHTPRDLPMDELVYVPDNAELFAAIGAVLLGLESARLVEAHQEHRPHATLASVSASLEDYLSRGRYERMSAYGAIRDGLVSSEEELDEFARRYAIPPFTPPSLDSGQLVRGIIGIDGGSTSTKLALIDEQGQLLYQDYMLSQGNPLADVRELFSRMCDWVDSTGIRLDVIRAAVTGYASEILDEAFSLDVRVVETVAHMRSATFYHGDVDIICDIGGQDIKVLFMKNGRVSDFRLNTQCSAGNGYFLQSMAEQFGVPIEEYAAHAFRASRAPAFNYGCAVFMEQDKVNFQRLGWSEDEIMAGLALVLPLNIWNYVVQESNIAKYGSRFVLQGGTQRNLAAVKSQVDFIRSKVPHAQVHVHRYADICGAIGAAIEAMESTPDSTSRFIGIEAASCIGFTTRNDATTRCRFCENRCPRTFVDITISEGDTIRFISGNACEKGKAEDVEQMKRARSLQREVKAGCPNLVEMAAREAFVDYDVQPMPGDRQRSGPGAADMRGRMVVGIPRLLNLFFYAPFFNAYFLSLGVGRIVTSKPTDTRLWEKGNKWGSIDPCFPAKVAPAHIQYLMQTTEVTHICVPIVTHLESPLNNTLGNNACVIQMGTAEVIHAAFTRGADLFAERHVEFLKPFVRMDRPAEAEGQLFEEFSESFAMTRDENEWAVKQGYAAQRRYLTGLRTEGTRTINWLVENDRMGVVALGHPYHHDPGINHGLLEEFQKKGFPVLCIESLPTDSAFLAPLFDNGSRGREFDITDVWLKNFNRNTNHKIWAARIIARHPNLAAVDLSSFKCGHDAPLYSYVDNIMDASGAPHFLFHDIDQNKPLGSMRIRLETFEYFLRLEEEKLRAPQ